MEGVAAPQDQAQAAAPEGPQNGPSFARYDRSGSPAEPASAAPIAPSEMFAFSRVFEDSAIPTGPSDVSSGADGSTDDEGDDDGGEGDEQPSPQGGESRPSADVTPPQPATAEDAPPPRPPSRRERERQERDAKIATLEAENARYQTPEYRQQVREEIAAEEAQRTRQQVDEDFLGNQQQYERLKARPYLDLSYEEQGWLDQREARRNQYAPVEQGFRAIYDQKLAELQAQAQAWYAEHQNQTWGDIKSDLSQQIEASTKLPGVDREFFKRPGVNWQQMAEHIAERAYAAGASAKEAELADRLQTAETQASRASQQVADRTANEAASRRAPATVGRSAGTSGPPVFDPKRGVGGNLAAAFAP